MERYQIFKGECLRYESTHTLFNNVNFRWCTQYITFYRPRLYDVDRYRKKQQHIYFSCCWNPIPMNNRSKACCYCLFPWNVIGNERFWSVTHNVNMSYQCSMFYSTFIGCTRKSEWSLAISAKWSIGSHSLLPLNHHKRSLWCYNFNDPLTCNTWWLAYRRCLSSFGF